ncbi:hypothetical protein [Paraburkholderia phosphatilytica]|uniref:hypothetical protein n=1 Tax=Paraburkholderia phosphatilytica TaxID=2282883 RepID=UPI000E54790C|nr:hypothetical protein [Paraburkholderia phosphatilytica]
MSSHCRSLRVLVNEWLGNAQHFRVTRPDRSKTMPWRAVRVEVSRSSGPLALVFFRHRDGSWCLYPPAAVQPAMNLLRN